jgi:UPF0716 protein FxsA
VFVVVLLLVLWPLVEIAVFLQVVQWIGVLDTLALMLAISICGAWLVKRQGVGTLARMRAELDAGRIPTGPMVDGALLAVAGFLLLVPGFVTDVFGLLLLIPFARRAVRTMLGRRFVVRAQRRVVRPTGEYYDLGPPPNRRPDASDGPDFPDRPELGP